MSVEEAHDVVAANVMIGVMTQKNNMKTVETDLM